MYRSLVHLDVERADRSTQAPDAHPDNQFFKIFVRQNGDLVAGLDAPVSQELRNLVRLGGKLAPGDRFATLVEIHQSCLAGVACTPFRQ